MQYLALVKHKITMKIILQLPQWAGINVANFGVFPWFAPKLMIDLVVVMIGGNLEQTGDLDQKGTALAKNRGQFWNQHACMTILINLTLVLYYQGVRVLSSV